MVFGMASALSFAYIPLIKVSGQPLIAYRTPPKSIIQRVCKQLGIRLVMEKFSDEAAGMAALDAALDRGELVGLQTSVFWLPYFPEAMRFHFNAHNLLVYGKDGDDYLISDPVFETVQRCASQDLRLARFAKGALAAKGLMYRLENVPSAAEIEAKMPHLLRLAIRKTAKQMNAPVFFAGYKGIHTLANKISKLEFNKNKLQNNALYLGHIVRMQEEIGTGGAGFRYLFAYFLQQAAAYLPAQECQQFSQQLTEIGDSWRLFAAQAVKQCRKPAAQGYAEVADSLHQLAERERAFWQALLRFTQNP